MKATSKTTSALEATAAAEPQFTTTEQLRRLAAECTYEIEHLAMAIIPEVQGVEDLVLRGLAIRIKNLNSVAMTVLAKNFNDELTPEGIKEMHLIVHGEPMETSHV